MCGKIYIYYMKIPLWFFAFSSIDAEQRKIISGTRVSELDKFLLSHSRDIFRSAFDPSKSD